MVEILLELFPTHSVCLWALEFDETIEGIFQAFQRLDGDAALVDADIVFHKEQLVTAVNVALQRHLAGRRRTRNLHTEILLALAAKLGVKESLEMICFAEGKQRCLVVAVNPGPSFETTVKLFAREVDARWVDFKGKEEDLFDYLTQKAKRDRVRELYGGRLDIGWICTKIAVVEYARQLR
ncbi:hypothetical protein CCYA_CCYA01G0285 [Cyanidiococcus yangmingshanensis]|uniref:Uncharacterized protein n=1 Tax=Cyanidiococcus yangmingshanensis TaxID=2690220 RepID=A0A7J7IQ42_9RHOD|nr:hypothetical protein F1559_003079 [Cyanidiococcus yangmingshanensis]KAK4529428.1 hypothetical protein CCYA_CCYA01G0285 [Cyanidiococcus yangmingshanensis]